MRLRRNATPIAREARTFPGLEVAGSGQMLPLNLVCEGSLVKLYVGSMFLKVDPATYPEFDVPVSSPGSISGEGVAKSNKAEDTAASVVPVMIMVVIVM